MPFTTPNISETYEVDVYPGNPGKLPLQLIEVQSGPYLGEDDIVRVADSYGRT